MVGVGIWVMFAVGHILRRDETKVGWLGKMAKFDFKFKELKFILI